MKRVKMKRVVLDNNDNPIVNKSRKEDVSDYSEDLKLNIACDEDDQHIAVLYCLKCETSLCKICSDSVHSRKTLANHHIVRLTKKPEPPVKCPLHPLEIAKLICKKQNCNGMNNPMCTICHQYGKHKGHKYEVLDDEYDKIRKNVANCSKEIEEKRAICEKNLEEYDKCISTYSNISMQTERDKIESFHLEARISALKTFDDFAKNRIEKLELWKNQCVEEKFELDNMSSEVRKIKEMQKMKMIENGGIVEKLTKQAAEKEIDQPTEIIPFDSYIVTYPNADAMSIKIDLPNHLKGLAFLFMNCSGELVLPPSETHPESVEEGVGQYYCNEEGRTTIWLTQVPDDDKIDLSRYKYACVMVFLPRYEEEDIMRLKKMIQKTLWNRIVVSIRNSNWLTRFFVNEVRKIAETDQRIEIVGFESTAQLLGLVFEH